jgi:hypothetical protein
MALYTFRSRARSEIAEVVGEENTCTMALLCRKRNADDAFDCKHYIDYFSVYEPCNKRVRYENGDARTVVGEVLEDLVKATSISLSIFSYFGGCRALVEDKDGGLNDPTQEPIFIMPSPSYDDGNDDEYDEDDEDDEDGEDGEDYEDDNSQMNGFIPLSPSYDAGISSSNNSSGDEDELFLNQEFKHIDVSWKKERFVGPFRPRVSFVKHGHLVVDYKGQRFRSLDKHSDRLIVAVDHSEAGLRRMVDSNTDDFHQMHICHDVCEILSDDEEGEAESSAARGPRHSTEEIGMTKGLYNSVKGTHLNDVKIQQSVKPSSVLALTSKKCKGKGCLDCHHQLDQNTMEYRRLITLSHLTIKDRNRWLNPNKIDEPHVSILKATTIFTQRTKVQNFYAGGLPLALALPPPILYKSKKKKKKKKKVRANWSTLPTRAFANVMNFLEIPQSKLYTVCRQWTVKFKKMYDTTYPLSNMLDILNTLNEHFVDRSLPNFPMDDLMAGSTSYLNNKEVRFSKQCYEKKGLSTEDLSEMYKEDKKDPWFGMEDCSWKYVYEVDHEEREQQLVWYMRSYDIHEESSSRGREMMLGGKIKTVFPRMSMPCVAVKAAIHWENYENYINEKSAITWEKSGKGEWIPVPTVGFEVVVEEETRLVYDAVYNARLNKALELTRKKLEKWKKKKLEKGIQIHYKDLDLDSDTTVARRNCSKHTDTNNDNTNAVDEAVVGTTRSLTSSATTSTIARAKDDGGINVVSPAVPSLPVLRGTLSYNSEPRQHLIRGMWNYENSNTLPSQKFELLRNLRDDETDTDLTTLPKDGEFHGSFSLAYHTTCKGKQKERSKVVSESGVKIKFTKIEDSNNEYKVDGTGVNEFGTFCIDGTAKPITTHDDDGQYTIEFRKRYIAKCTTVTRLSPKLQNIKRSQKRSTQKTKRNDHTSLCFSRSKDQLRMYGLEDANKSPFSGNDMFYPNIIKKEEYYQFVRLVQKPSDKLPTAFYCFLCEKEYVYSAGNSNQLKRHNEQFSQNHAKKQSSLGESGNGKK